MSRKYCTHTPLLEKRHYIDHKIPAENLGRRAPSHRPTLRSTHANRKPKVKIPMSHSGNPPHFPIRPLTFGASLRFFVQKTETARTRIRAVLFSIRFFNWLR